MSEHYVHLQLLYSISMNSVLSLGRRHNAEIRNPIRQTREKVCVVLMQSAELRARFYQLEVQVINV